MSRQAPFVNPPQANGSLWIRIAVLAAVVLAAGMGYWMWGDDLSLSHLAQKESQLREFQAEHPLLVYALAFAVYVTVTGLSLPGAAALTLVSGWYFGVLRGVLLVSFASTTGATLAFLLSRFLFRETVQRKFGSRLATFNQALQREGAFYLFALRLVPAVPFFVINAVMGLTPIRTRTFWWVSQLGMLAGTAVYVYAGSVVPDLQTLADNGLTAVFTASQVVQIVTALALLGLFPWLARALLQWRTARKGVPPEMQIEQDAGQAKTSQPGGDA